jgi:nicotinate-nucleotide adenylyltransferase
MTERIGIFGGTFDPPHVGHLILASEVRAELQLDRVLWVLTAVPPHKLGQDISPLEDRLAMLRLCLDQEPGFALSTVDMDRPGPHYTLDTVRLLAAQNHGDRMILLLGGDSLHDLPTWHEPVALVSECDEIAVMRRPGDLIDLSALEPAVPGLTRKIRFVDAPLLEIASREIRERARDRRPFRYFVLPSVFEYIDSHRLYQAS